MYEMKPNFFSSSNKSAFTLEGDSFWKYTASTNSVKCGALQELLSLLVLFTLRWL